MAPTNDEVSSIIESYTASSQVSPENAAHEIDNLLPQTSDGTDLEQFLMSVWYSLNVIIVKTPASDPAQQRLVDLVAALKGTSRTKQQIWGDEMRIWEDLPLIGVVMRDWWNFIPICQGTGKDTSKTPERINLVSFTARILGASIRPWTNFALWDLRDALEEPSSPENTDHYITTTCEWFTHAGGAIYEECRKEEKPMEEKARSLRGGKLLGGSPGFSMERWEFWRHALGELGQKASTPELKARAAGVVQMMKSLES